MTGRIALVEDDDVILQNYADFLRASRFEVDAYATKHSALQGILQRPPELAVLDISLNGERDAGFVICAAVRQQYPQLPIVFLTSHDGEVDKISGLRLGADDYLTKDTSMDFLVVRIEALLRRRDAYLQGAQQHPLRVPGTELQLDRHALIASWRGSRLDLTLTQFWILAEICREPGQARSHDELMRAARIVVEPNTIAAHIKAVREEFRRVDPAFDAIRTERGRGYRWLLPG